MIGKRIILYSGKEISLASLLGLGLPNRILDVDQPLSPQDLNDLSNLGSGDGVMIVGGGTPFHWLREKYHFGVRNENWSDCTKLRRLAIEGGAYIKVVADPPTPKEIAYFMSTEFNRDVVFPNFKQDIISTLSDANKFLDWLDSFPLDEWMACDFEASGMALEKWFEISGLSFAVQETASFISFTDIRHELGIYGVTTENIKSGPYYELCMRIGRIVQKRQDHLLVFNMQYEYQVFHRCHGVDAYNLCDVSAINVIAGDHLNKKFSLKWTGQKYLEVPVWDADFDRLSDLIDQMLFEEVGKLKADKHKELKVTPQNYEQTPEWAEICTRLKYRVYIDEMKSLLNEYWGNAYMCIPSAILGFYCNLDAFYTLMIFKSQEKNYTEECWQTFFDNTRMGVRLHTGGLYINEPYRAAYDKYCGKQMAFGVTYCALARCWIKMGIHKDKAANPKNYSPLVLLLMKDGHFFGGDPVEITKWLLSSYIDNLDVTDTGIDEGGIAMKFGPDFALKVTEIARTRMKEIKFKGKIDDSIVRKKKLLGLIAEDISNYLGIPKLRLGPKHEELEKFLYYERNYKELYKISHGQLSDPDNIPDTIKAFRQKWTPIDYANYVSDEFFKCKSPAENDEIAYELTSQYRHQTAWLAAMFDSNQQLPETDKFYGSRGITDINQAYSEFMNEWKIYFSNLQEREDHRDRKILIPGWHSQLYPDKVFNLALEGYQSLKKTKDTAKSAKTGKAEYIYSLGDRVKEMWTDFSGWTAQEQLFPWVKDQWAEYGKPFEPEDFNDDFFFMRKMALMYLMYKKYSKVQTTYIGEQAMFGKTAKWVIEDEHHIPYREADPTEPGAVKKLFIRYQVNEKSSKRWSSGFHTIISHSDLKNCLAVPPTFEPDGTINYASSSMLMSYFDINY